MYRRRRYRSTRKSSRGHRGFKNSFWRNRRGRRLDRRAGMFY